jgi:DNA modification methylase
VRKTLPHRSGRKQLPVRRWSIEQGNCVEIMQNMSESLVDAIVTDPPYGLEFMGKEWDKIGDVRQPDDATFHRSGVGPYDRAKVRHSSAPSYGIDGNQVMQEWHGMWACEALRVLKPGGYLLAFGGTRTSHRLTCALEDAGFEIRDVIMWLYGSGFPKSHNLKGDMNGWGTALKPAYEPIVVARKPFKGTVAANVLANGTGALNIDGCRISTNGEVVHVPQSDPGARAGVVGTDLGITRANKERFQQSQRDSIERLNEQGRWPANVILDEEAAEMLDTQSGERKTSKPGTTANVPKFDGDVYNKSNTPQIEWGYGDSGGASRFFYCAKASRSERESGMNDNKNHHPTVKPVALMRYLVRLITPPNGIVLDMFLGSGTTGIAAILEGLRFIGIEREPEYIEIARARIKHWAEK